MKAINEYSLLFVFLFISGLVIGQTPEEYEANYAERIKLEMINGVYIPTDLEDAFSELSRLASTDGLAAFKAAPEDSIRRKLHFGLGRWILINWGIEDGSRLTEYMKSLDIYNPDDMVEVIIVAWHRQLNGEPLKIEDEVITINERIAEEKKKRDAQKEVIILETRPHKEE